MVDEELTGPRGRICKNPNTSNDSDGARGFLVLAEDNRCPDGPLLAVKRTWRLHFEISANDAVDGASSAASKCYRLVASKPERFKEVRPGNETAFGVLKELARTRRRNADKVVARIGRTRVGQRTLKCVVLIGTRSAQSIMASGFTAAQTGRTHDRTRPMLHRRQKVLAKAPSTHDPKRTWRLVASLFSRL